MALNEGGNYADNGEIKLILIGVAVIVLFLIGITAWQNYAKREQIAQIRKKYEVERAKHPFPDISTDFDAAEAKADELTLKCKGDVTNLSTDEYEWLNSATTSHAAEFLAGRYKLLMKQDKEKKEKDKKEKVLKKE